MWSDRSKYSLLSIGGRPPFGFLFRKQKLCDSLIIYTAALVIFSSAMTNQYLALVIAFVSLYLNWALIVYVVIGT